MAGCLSVQVSEKMAEFRKSAQALLPIACAQLNFACLGPSTGHEITGVDAGEGKLSPLLLRQCGQY